MFTGPSEDPHFAATHRYEGVGIHKQASPLQAAVRAWYFRSEWYKKLVPDTRRCWVHGEIMFPELTLTPEEQNIRSPMSTNIITGQPSDYDAPR